MKFSRLSKVDELINKFDSSLEGTVFAGLISAVLIINDAYTNDKDYFYDSENEQLKNAANFIYQCGTPQLTNILSSMEERLGYDYSNRLEKLIDEMLKISKRIPQDLYEDIPTNFSQQNFNMITDFIGGTLKAVGIAKGFQTANKFKWVRDTFRSSQAARDAKALKIRTDRQITRSEKAATTKLNEAQTTYNEAKTAAESVKDNMQTLDKKIKVGERAAESAKSTLNEATESLNKVNKRSEAIANAKTANDTTGTSAEVKKSAKQTLKDQKKELREKGRVELAKRDLESAQTKVEDNSKKLNEIKSEKEKLVTRDTANENLNKAREELKELQSKNNDLAAQSKVEQEKILARRTATESIFDKGKAVGYWLGPAMYRGVNLTSAKGAKQAAFFGGLDALGNKFFGDGSEKAAEQVVEQTTGKVVDASKQLSKVNYR